MKKASWIYLGNHGSRTKVGLMHSPRKGHLMIYSNMKVVIIDFNVFETSSYPLFIDEELCHIHITKVGNGFEYSFEIDEKADTPLNQYRKEKGKKDWNRSLMLFSVVFIFAILGVIGGRYLTTWEKTQQLAKNGVLKKAQILLPSADDENQKIAKIKFYNGKNIIKRQFNIGKQRPIILASGLPLEDGDEFYINVARNNFSNFEILYDKPSDWQMTRYRNRAKYMHKTSNTTHNSDYTDCLLKIAFDLKGIDGYALFYNQKESAVDNELQNAVLYKEFINSKVFLEKEEDCWQLK